MNKKNDYNTVAIPIETTARELNSKIYIADSLAQAGFRCFVGVKDRVFNLSKTAGNVIYLDKGYHKGISDKIYQELKEAGCLLVSLDEENGVDFRDFNMLDTRMPDKFLSTMDLIFLWGQAQNRHLQANRTQYDESRIRVSGHPRFDILKGDYSKLYAEKVAEIKEKYGSFILFNTNSKYSNNINGRDVVVQNYSSRVRDLDKRLEYDDKRLAHNISVIKRISTELGLNVVIRPHPEENIDIYKETFKDYENVHPIYEDSAIYWIIAAETVIHNHSTTGLEAAMLGKSPISFTPIKMEENFCPWIPIAVSHNIETEQDLVDLFKTEGWRKKPNEMGPILKDFFSYQETAMDNVKSAITTLRNTTNCPKKGESLCSFLLKCKFQDIKASFTKVDNRSRLARNKLQDLKKDIILEKYTLMRQASPSMKKTKLKIHSSDLFEICPI